MTKRRIWLLLPVTTPFGSRAEGECHDAGVRVPHHSFGSTSTRETRRHPQLMYRLARLTKTVVFLPTALRCGTRRNAFSFETCKKNYIALLAQGAKNGKCFPEASGAASIPSPKGQGFTPRFW
jgi:hypothetical protein